MGDGTKEKNGTEEEKDGELQPSKSAVFYGVAEKTAREDDLDGSQGVSPKCLESPARGYKYKCPGVGACLEYSGNSLEPSVFGSSVYNALCGIAAAGESRMERRGHRRGHIVTGWGAGGNA